MSITENPIFIGMFLIAIIGILYFKFFNRKGYSEFVPQKLSKTTQTEFKEKLKEHGININGKLVVGYNVVSHISKWLIIKGSFYTTIYDDKNKKYTVNKNKKVEYDLLCLESKNKNLLYRILGLKKSYYLLNVNTVTFNEMSKSWILQSKNDIVRYADIWVNSDSGIEYINDISFKTLTESTMTHVQNMPDRIVHLEVEQAKRNQLKISEIEAYKGKYEAYKQAEDTSIS